MKKPIEDIHTLLAKHPLFDNLSSEQLGKLTAYVRAVHLDEGVLVFEEGDAGDEFYFVATGRLNVLKLNARGMQANLLTLMPGRIFGEMSIIDDAPRSATVRTASAVSLIAMSRGDFEKLGREHPAITLEIMRNVARLLSLYLRNASGKLVDKAIAA